MGQGGGSGAEKTPLKVNLWHWGLRFYSLEYLKSADFRFSWRDTKILTPDLGSRKGLIQRRYQDICKRNFQFWPPGG